MFYRKIYKKIEDRKKLNNHKPLIIEGLRQVGKTTIVKEFAKKNYKNVVYIDFRKEPKFKSVFDDGYDIDKIILKLSALNEEFNFIEKETLIIFDEIQDAPKARGSLKYFYLDGRYEIIATGSLLGIKNYNLSKNQTTSVGYESFLRMYPMDFEEFLIANNKEKLSNILKDSLNKKEEIDGVFHTLALELFKEFLIVGGMPEVVNIFLETKNLNLVYKKQKELLLSFEDDFGRHINEREEIVRDPTLFNRILKTNRSIPLQLAKENNKFQYSRITHGSRAREYEEAIEWLIDYGLIYKSCNLKRIEIPLISYKDESSFKLFYCDSGLLLASYEYGIFNEIMNDEKGVYKGAIYENVVATLLKINDFDLYYYSKNSSSLEIDFVIRNNDYPLLVEVKATNNYAKSLNMVMTYKKDYGEDNIKAIKLYSKNIVLNNNDIINLPYYLMPYFNKDVNLFK